MYANIVSTANYKAGQFYVNVAIDGKQVKRCKSLYEAEEFLRSKKENELDRVYVLLRELFIYPKKELKYETSYAV